MEFVRASGCESGACVEVGDDDDMVVVRNSALGDMVNLMFTKAEWAAFVDGVKHDEFDFAD